MVNDPIADLLTRMRNILARGKGEVKIPHSNLIEAVVKVIRDEGFVESYELTAGGDSEVQGDIEIKLKYIDNEPMITSLEKVSKPGVRVYHGYRKIKKVLGGRGISVYSTPQGVMTGDQARRRNIGGECLCIIW